MHSYVGRERGVSRLEGRGSLRTLGNFIENLCGPAFRTAHAPHVTRVRAARTYPQTRNWRQSGISAWSMKCSSALLINAKPPLVPYEDRTSTGCHRGSSHRQFRPDVGARDHLEDVDAIDADIVHNVTGTRRRERSSAEGGITICFPIGGSRDLGSECFCRAGGNSGFCTLSCCSVNGLWSSRFGGRTGMCCPGHPSQWREHIP